MNRTKQEQVYIKSQWSDHEMLTYGFLYYQPIKHLTMARMVVSDETLNSVDGYWIAYVAGDTSQENGDDYQLRLIAPDIFHKSYQPWDETNWQATSIEAHLLSLNCQAYYKSVGVWAKQLSTPRSIQSMESGEIAVAPKGTWLCITMERKAWTIPEAHFYAQYLLPGHKSLIKA
jgi:hypothetical protein